MKTLIRVLILAAFVLLSNACEPDPDPEPEPDTSIEFNINDQTHSATPVQTVLGEDRLNPYTVDNMTQAADNVYGVSRTGGPMPTTNLYVKFTPSSLDDIEAMYDTDETFYDFPLTREVVAMGDYYQNLAQDEFPELYAVVPPNFQFPSVPYQILAPLHIAPYDTYLAQEAFALTNNTYDGIPSQTPQQSLTICTPDDPNHPECECDIFLGNQVAYDDCINNLYNDPTPDPPTPTDVCTCSTYGHHRKPAGRVRVEDTQLSTTCTDNPFIPVRRVKVIMKDTWFTEDETWTDDNGCWKINDKYYGRAWMWVKFKNDRCQIRGATDSWRAIYQWAVPVKDYVGVINGPNFDNINVNYESWTNQGSPAHIYWGAATVNNAVHEFHDYADDDGINPPPDDLDIYVANGATFGYAIMSVQQEFSASVAAVLTAGASIFIGPFAPIVGVVGYAVTIAALPDVCIGINFNNSDRLKWLAYHEIAHASHYTQAGHAFWRDLAASEVLANGHGDQNSTNAGLIALCESWAEHIGASYNDRTYGLNETLPLTSYQEYLEEVRNEELNHIPIGYYNDLIDGINLNEIACEDPWPPVNDCGIIVDGVEGFTNTQMFSVLDASVRSPADFTNDLILNHLGATPNTTQQVLDLFDSY